MSGKFGSRTMSPCGVDLAEGEQRHRGARVDQRLDARRVGGGRLVVDVDLAALQGQADRPAALEPEDGVDVGTEQVERHEGGEVEPGGADAAELQRRGAVDQVLGAVDAGARAAVDHGAGAVGQHRGEVVEVVPHLGAAEQPRNDARRRADQQVRAVGLGARDEAVGAGDALATGVVDRCEAWLTGKCAGESLADEPGPGIGSTALRERDDDLDGLAGEVPVAGGGGPAQQPAAEDRRQDGQDAEDRHDRGGRPPVGRWWVGVRRGRGGRAQGCVLRHRLTSLCRRPGNGRGRRRD